MFRAKTSKIEQIDKSQYTLYHPHTLGPEERKWTTQYYQVISIDPAQKNLALRIERRYLTGKIETLVFDKVDITGGLGESTAQYIDVRYDNLTKFLDQFKQYYPDTHMFIIERQLAVNYRSVRISQHAISYFLLTLKDAKHLPYIIEISPQIKTRELGAEKGLNKNQIKKWAVARALLLLKWRDDKEGLKIMQKHKRKQDDLADTVCQIEALFSLWGLPLTKEPSQIPVLTRKVNVVISNDEKSVVKPQEKKNKVRIVT